MNISMHNASVGVYLKLLGNLNVILEKAEKWVAERKIDPSAILQARLAPDMFTFTRQIQIVTDMAKGTAARLAGQEPPRYEDTETSFSELKARVAKTIAYLQGLDTAGFNGCESRAITLKLARAHIQDMAIELQFFGLKHRTTTPETVEFQDRILQAYSDFIDASKARATARDYVTPATQVASVSEVSADARQQAVCQRY